MNDRGRQIILLFSIMMVLSALTIFLIETSDNKPESEPQDERTPPPTNSSFSYTGPASSLINQSIQGLKDLSSDVDFSIFADSRPDHDENQTE